MHNLRPKRAQAMLFCVCLQKNIRISEILHHLQDQKFETRTILKKGTKIKTIPVENSTVSEYIVYLEEEISEDDFVKLNISGAVSRF